MQKRKMCPLCLRRICVFPNGNFRDHKCAHNVYRRKWDNPVSRTILEMKGIMPDYSNIPFFTPKEVSLFDRKDFEI